MRWQIRGEVVLLVQWLRPLVACGERRLPMPFLSATSMMVSGQSACSSREVSGGRVSLLKRRRGAATAQGSGGRVSGDVAEWVESASRGSEGHPASSGRLLSSSLVEEMNASRERRKMLLSLSDAQIAEVLQQFITDHSGTLESLVPGPSSLISGLRSLLSAL